MTDPFSDLPSAAVRQLADYDARQPGTMFGEGLSLDVRQAYELQAEVARLRVQRGERVIGYKVGCTSATIREQLGISHSVFGRLFDCEHHPSGVTLSCQQFASLAIEGELAVELTRPPRDEDFRPDHIPACVRRVLPVIELHHHVMRGERPSAGELIANNAIHAGFCRGAGLLWPAEERVDADALILKILINDEPVEVCGGQALVQTISHSLHWLWQQLPNENALQAGHVVLTGSLPPLIPMASGGTVRVEAGCFGSVEATFADDANLATN